MKKIFSISLKTIAVLSVTALAAGYIFTGELVQIYVDISDAWNVPVYEMAKEGFRIVCLGFVFMGFSVFASSMFTALNNAVVSGILAVSRTLVFILITVLVFSHFWGVDGIWWAIPFAEIPAIIMTVFFFIKMRSRYGYA